MLLLKAPALRDLGNEPQERLPPRLLEFLENLVDSWVRARENQIVGCGQKPLYDGDCFQVGVVLEFLVCRQGVEMCQATQVERAGLARTLQSSADNRPRPLNERGQAEYRRDPQCRLVGIQKQTRLGERQRLAPVPESFKIPGT